MCYREKKRSSPTRAASPVTYDDSSDEEKNDLFNRINEQNKKARDDAVFGVSNVKSSAKTTLPKEPAKSKCPYMHTGTKFHYALVVLYRILAIQTCACDLLFFFFFFFPNYVRATRLSNVFLSLTHVVYVALLYKLGS